MAKLKVLVLGDGLLGGELVKQTGWDYVSRRKDGLDIENFWGFIPKNDRGNPIHNVIVNCIANTDTYSNKAQQHWDVNYKFVDSLIEFCNIYNIKLVHISTDYVYAGSTSRASEQDVPVHANNWYTYTKLLADALVQLRSKEFIVVRCSHKPTPFPYADAWVNQVGNFDSVDVIADLIIQMVNGGLSGLFNVGTKLKTMYELASRRKTGVKRGIAPSYVPTDISMDTYKLNLHIKSVNAPFFSIAIPTYGYAGKGTEFLNHSFELLYRQSFQDFEVVVSDHSIDDTILEVCDSWMEKLRITYIRNDKGRGIISPNINNAMRHCAGKWIKVLFQDDFLYDESSLKTQYDILEVVPETKWAMTTFYHSNDGKTFYNYYTPKWHDTIWTGDNTMGCPSGLTMRNKDLIFFDEGLNWLMDCDYYQKMFIKHGKPLIIGSPTYVNRTWGARLTDTIKQDLKDKEYNMLSDRYVKD